VTPSGVATRAAVPGAPVTPAGAASLLPASAGLTAADLALLDAVERLAPRMDAVFRDSPRAMTPATLQGLAGELRACSLELARVGTPSAWLRPVHDLARQACREYDQGADCFDDAAGALSASGVQHDLDCGFAAASRGGRPLAAARQRSEELLGSR
jgi:hypothetical protein